MHVLKQESRQKYQLFVFIYFFLDSKLKGGLKNTRAPLKFQKPILLDIPTPTVIEFYLYLLMV